MLVIDISRDGLDFSGKLLSSLLVEHTDKLGQHLALLIDYVRRGSILFSRKTSFTQTQSLLRLGLSMLAVYVLFSRKTSFTRTQSLLRLGPSILATNFLVRNSILEANFLVSYRQNLPTLLKQQASLVTSDKFDFSGKLLSKELDFSGKLISLISKTLTIIEILSVEYTDS